jgi:glycosyltransferase involved in cell wall biosynthesis
MAVAGALTEKMRELITGQEVLERFSDLGKARVENDYSWRVLIPRYLEMYTAVLGA